MTVKACFNIALSYQRDYRKRPVETGTEPLHKRDSLNIQRAKTTLRSAGKCRLYLKRRNLHIKRQKQSKLFTF